jgi:MFS family permease
MLSLLIDPIRRDLAISDTQIGLLTGFAFAAMYAVLGVALGRVADTGNRVRLISAGLAVWSVATASCGLARSFWQLFAARVAVGAGEATLTPTAYSLFSDYFSSRRLGRAVAVYTLAQYFGMGAALVLGGLLASRLAHLPPVVLPGVGALRPWQLAMMIVAVPGLLVLPLMRTVRETRTEQPAAPPADARLAAVLGQLRSHWVVYLTHFTGFSLAGLYATGLATWLPEFYRRTYGWPIQRAGLALALILIGVGAPSTLMGGWLADRLRERRLFAAPMLISAAAVTVLWPLGVLLPLAKTPTGALILLGLVTIFLTLPTAVAPAALQLVTPPRMRGQISATYLLCTNLIGTGAGPYVVGLTTDRVFGSDAGLKLSLSAVAGVVCPLTVLVLLAGSRAFARAAADDLTGRPQPAG